MGGETAKKISALLLTPFALSLGTLLSSSGFRRLLRLGASPGWSGWPLPRSRRKVGAYGALRAMTQTAYPADHTGPWRRPSHRAAFWREARRGYLRDFSISPQYAWLRDLCPKRRRDRSYRKRTFGELGRRVFQRAPNRRAIVRRWYLSACRFQPMEQTSLSSAIPLRRAHRLPRFPVAVAAIILINSAAHPATALRCVTMEWLGRRREPLNRCGPR